MAELLVVRDLQIGFATPNGRLEAVTGVSFEIGAGEVVGLVGESGCGKSVTALSLLGLLPSGSLGPGSSIRVDGRELAAGSARGFREVRGSRIAMVFQDPHSSLNPVLPVGEQVAEVLRRHRGMDRPGARAAAGALLEEVGLPASELVDEPPHRLSGGMRQRVMIAAALAGEPGLLVADEPTTALDVTVQAQILGLLARLRAERGMAVLLISHDLEVVARVSDRILVMYAGELVETGPTAALFRDPRHPYTRALLDARPKLSDGRAPRSRLEGAPPSPLDWPQGCRLRSRCPFADPERCAREQALESVGEDRAVRCVRHPELELEGS